LFQKDDAAPQLDMERFVNRDQTAICQIKVQGVPPLAASSARKSAIMGDARAYPPPLQDHHHHETRHVYFDNVHVGTIRRRAGVPVGFHQWGWSCGFYPGCEPGEHRHGTAPDFFTARREFEIAWRDQSATKTEADYQEWRDRRDMMAEIQAKRARGEKLDSKIPSWMTRWSVA
jgi:hypothetical protein